MQRSLIVLSWLASPALSAPCPIPTTATAALSEVVGATRTMTTRRKDPDSGEPVLRTIIDYPSGSTIVVEQSNCSMENLRISILSPDAMPLDRDLAQAGRILGAMPIWTRNYPGRKAADVFRGEIKSAQFQNAKGAGAFFYAVDQRLDARTSATEAIVSFTSSNSPAVQYMSQMSLYLGIGGL